MINPIIYPPVGPANTPNPDLKFANTGSPIAPINIYNDTEIIPSTGLSINITKNIAIVCNVKGIVVGIVTRDIAHIIDVNIAI